jgi:hypothetical protein
MPVVINEFEVLPESQPEARKPAAEPGGESSPPQKIDPCALASALRARDVRVLRVWAH